MGRKPTKKERKDNPDKKLEWIQILIPYFQKHGLKNVTMDQVAKVLKKSKATIYKYFRTREEIIQFGLLYKLNGIQHFEEILMNEDTPYLDRYFQSIAHLSGNVADISNLFLSDLKYAHPELWQQVMQFIENTMTVIKEYYQKGIDKGIFNNVSTDLMVMSDRFFFAALSDPDFLISHNLTIDEAFRQYFRMKFFGIVKDQKLLKKYETVIK